MSTSPWRSEDAVTETAIDTVDPRRTSDGDVLADVVKPPAVTGAAADSTAGSAESAATTITAGIRRRRRARAGAVIGMAPPPFGSAEPRQTPVSNTVDSPVTCAQQRRWRSRGSRTTRPLRRLMPTVRPRDRLGHADLLDQFDVPDGAPAIDPPQGPRPMRQPWTSTHRYASFGHGLGWAAARIRRCRSAVRFGASAAELRWVFDSVSDSGPLDQGASTHANRAHARTICRGRRLHPGGVSSLTMRTGRSRPPTARG